MHHEIDRLRRRIDKLDERITQLLVERCDLVEQLIELKRILSVPVEDLPRERDILENVAKRAGSHSELLRVVYRQLFAWAKDQP